MDDSTRTRVTAALTTARALIEQRGYQPEWGRGGDSPLNISNALTLACENYETYVLARQSFSKNWGGPEAGLLFWETYKRRTKSEVMELFATVIGGLDCGEVNPSSTTHTSGAV